ncbi:MAG: capsule assembly Wzi family protein [Pseudomonadota bacterium]
MRVRFLAILFVAGLILPAGPARGEILPWDSWEMAVLDHWMNSEGNGAWVSQIRPVTTDYALSLLGDLEPEDKSVSDQIDALSSLIGKTVVNTGPFHLSVKVLGSYFYARPPAVKLLQLPAYENPLLAGNEGAFIDGGQMGTAGMRLSGHWTDYFSFDATPVLRLSSRDTALTDNASLYLKEAVATIRLNRLAVEGGRANLLWGSGRYGHLLFSGDNPPLDLVRVRSIEPVTPPWVLKYLGPTQFDAFFGILGEDRVFPHTRLVGTFISFLPHKRFEFGLGQTVLFGGEGGPTNNPMAYFSEKIGDAPDSADRNFLLSGRFRIPAIEIELYSELMIEDCCGPFPFDPRDTMYLMGLYFPRIDPEGKADFAVEWVRTNHVAYRHGTFTSGYTHEGRMLGHPLGPDAMGIYAILRYFPSKEFWGKATFAFEDRGKSGESISGGSITGAEPTYQSPELRYRMEFDLRFRPTEALAIGPRFGIERVSHFGYQTLQKRWMVQSGLNVDYTL